MGALFSKNSTEDYDSSELEEEVSDSSSEDNIMYNYKHSHSDGSAADSSDDIGLDCTTTDAAVSSTRAFTTIRLTLPDVTMIEDDLDFYEKVAIVFLLYDHPYCALQALLDDMPKDLLLTWAKKKLSEDKKWQEELVEALCIIQNYKVLKLFGLHKAELNERFLPNRPCTSLNVDKRKKVLYGICENLSKTETDELLQLVQTDFRRKSLNFKTFSLGFLEMYLLYWEHIGYITRNNVSNIYNIFKQLDYLTICDDLKAIVPETNVPVRDSTPTSFQPKPENFFKAKLDRKISSRTVDASAGNEPFDRVTNASLSDMSLTSTVSNVAINRNPDLCYTINNNNPGVCLIITQKHFYKDIEDQNAHLLPQPPIRLENRYGTEKDRDELISTFERFRFTTIVKNDLTHLQIIDEIKGVVQKIKEESSLFVCIMSHGDEGIVYGVNSCKVEIKTVQNIVCNSKSLLGKPKILILQSCQGNKCQKLLSLDDSLDDELETDSPSGNQVVPVTADMLTFWATVPGYGAIRSKRSGSWFIQSLCKAMKEIGHSSHFEDICTSIVNEVSGMKWSKENEDVAMVPLKMSTLRKQFYLPVVDAV